MDLAELSKCEVRGCRCCFAPEVNRTNKQWKVFPLSKMLSHSCCFSCSIEDQHLVAAEGTGQRKFF